MFDDFIGAFQNFSRAKTRTFLSLLGVIIGVASVIIITSLGASSAQEIKAMFGGEGLDLVTVNSGFMSRRNRSQVSAQFTESVRQEIFDNIKNLKKVWYKNNFSATISYGDASVSANCSAVEVRYLETYGMQLDAGEYFSATDDFYGAQKIILGAQIAEGLFPDGAAVGRNVIVVCDGAQFSFKVCAVAKKKDTGIEDSSSGVFVPRGFYAKKIKPNPDAHVAILQATNPEYCTKIVSDVTEYFSEKTGNPNAIFAMSMQSFLEQMNSMQKTMSLMLSSIAAISLLVGGIGIMNIMIVTVTERKKEIGIRKALGASPFAIRRQFLVESACVTLTGGAAGLVFGVGISVALEYARNRPIAVQWPACALAFFFSVLVGIFFGLNPASRAAKLDPVAALAES